MEERLKAWKKEQDDLSAIFRKLCQCRKKTLQKANEGIIEHVAKKQLEFLKRVNVFTAVYMMVGIIVTVMKLANL